MQELRGAKRHRGAGQAAAGGPGPGIPRGPTAIRRILFFNRSFYFDDSNGAAIAQRSLAECLARHGFAVEVLCGALVEAGPGGDPADWLAGRGWGCEEVGGNGWMAGAAGVRALDPPHLRLTVAGVPITAHRRPLRRFHLPGAAESRESLRLLDAAFDRFRPDVLVTYGGDPLTLEVLARARRRGVATVFVLHNFGYTHPAPFAHVDAVVVPSRFAAAYYARTLGLSCTILPCCVDPARVRAEHPDPRYVTFVNPSIEKGVYAFARIADELGRRRPDIPLLVVEGRGTEATLVGCGLDLRAHDTVSLMAHTPDPRQFWGVSRLCLMPSLWLENQPLTAIEAMLNGIPVLGSDRGGLPETLGGSGVVLPLPARLTPATRILPTAEEVAPWVEAILRLWDDSALYNEYRRRARHEAESWRPERVEPRHLAFFEGVRSITA